jgi:hypothetical protein
MVNKEAVSPFLFISRPWLVIEACEDQCMRTHSDIYRNPAGSTG